MNNNNILITSAGQRVSLVKAFQKELKKRPCDAKVFAVDMNPVLAPACHIADEYRTVPRVIDDNYIERLIEICEEWRISIIIPTIDTELKILSENKTTFKNKGISIIVSEKSFVDICRDKRQMNEFFKERGIDIPKSVDKKAPTFPLFIKPYDGSLSKDTFVIRKEEELTDYHRTNPKLMYMEYMDPKEYDEYTVDTYYDKKGILKCVVPRKRIFVRAGEINKGVTHKNEIVAFIKQQLYSIDGAVGCLTMQFFLHQKTKRIVGIEINPRFGGGYPLSYLAGANFPKNIIDEYLYNKEIEYSENWENNLLMLRYDDEILVHNYEE